MKVLEIQEMNLKVQETTKAQEAQEIMKVLEVQDKKVAQEVIERIVKLYRGLKLSFYFCIKGCFSYSSSNFLLDK